MQARVTLAGGLTFSLVNTPGRVNPPTRVKLSTCFQTLGNRACEQSLFCSKIRTRGSKISLARARYFASFSADFRAKERLLAVYSGNGKPANHSIGSSEPQLSGIKRSRSRTINDRFRSLCRLLVFMAGRLAVDVQYDRISDVRLKKGF